MRCLYGEEMIEEDDRLFDMKIYCQVGVMNELCRGKSGKDELWGE